VFPPFKLSNWVAYITPCSLSTNKLPRRRRLAVQFLDCFGTWFGFCLQRFEESGSKDTRYNDFRHPDKKRVDDARPNHDKFAFVTGAPEQHLPIELKKEHHIHDHCFHRSSVAGAGQDEEDRQYRMLNDYYDKLQHHDPLKPLNFRRFGR